MIVPHVGNVAGGQEGDGLAGGQARLAAHRQCLDSSNLEGLELELERTQARTWHEEVSPVVKIKA